MFDNCEVLADNLIGGVEGKGFSQVLGALEAGRVNIAARAVGVDTAAFESAIEYSQKRDSFGVSISKHKTIQDFLIFRYLLSISWAKRRLRQMCW